MSDPVKQAERASETAGRERLATIAQFQEQCYLLQVKDEIVKKLSGSIRVDLHGVSETGVKEKVFTYDHVVAIHPPEPELFPSQIHSVDGARLFFDLTPEVLSQLKPQLELYKLYPRRKVTNEYPGVPYKVLMPTGESVATRTNPIIADHNQTQHAGALRASFSSIDDIFRDQLGVLGNVMPSSLNITFRGEDPAQVNIVDDFNFSLHFSSFQLFNHVFEDRWIDPDTNDSKPVYWSYKDLISWSDRFLGASGEKAPAINKISSTDYIGAEPCVEHPTSYEDIMTQTNEMKASDEHFEIQAVLKYDDKINFDLVDSIRGSVEGTFSEAERAELKNFLRSSALVFRLQFKEHVVVYPDATVSDPGIQINFKYAAYLEDVLNTPDLNIIETTDPEQKDMASFLANLAAAERLLRQVQAAGIKLQPSLSEGNNNEYSKTYAALREFLVDPGGTHSGQGKTSWLINLPYKKDRQISMDYNNIVVSAKAVRKEQKRTEGTKKTPKWHPGPLKYDKNGLPSNTPENAVAVFQELVRKYRLFVKSKRRGQKSRRYKSLFKLLHMKGRIYGLDAILEDIGLTSGGEVGSEAAAAARRVTSQLIPKRIRPINPTDNLSSSDVDKIIEKFAKALEETTDNDQKWIATAKEQLKAELHTKTKKNKGGVLDPLGKTKITGTGKQRVKSIYFTTLGDLVDVAIDLATYKGAMFDKSGKPTYSGGNGLFKRRMGVLFGPLVDWHTGTGRKATSINLSQVPISLKMLMKFWAENVISKDRQEYYLGEFIRDVVQKLITKALGEQCLEGAGNRSETVKILQFTAPMEEHKDLGGPANGWIPPFYPIDHASKNYPKKGASMVQIKKDGTALGIDTKGNKRKLKFNGGKFKFSKLTEISPNTPMSRQFNYMYIYVNNYIPSKLDPSNKKANIAKGVYYLELGKVPGVFKTYGFKRLSIPWLRESRIHSLRKKQGELQLRDVYDFEVTMFGNNIFKPGMIIFVDPRREGGTNYQQWKELGIGGFYLITAVDHVALAGDTFHETTINAKWITFGGCA